MHGQKNIKLTVLVERGTEISILRFGTEHFAPLYDDFCTKTTVLN